jgi:hypothetical protein
MRIYRSAMVMAGLASPTGEYLVATGDVKEDG